MNARLDMSILCIIVLHIKEGLRWFTLFDLIKKEACYDRYRLGSCDCGDNDPCRSCTRNMGASVLVFLDGLRGPEFVSVRSFEVLSHGDNFEKDGDSGGAVR